MKPIVAFVVAAVFTFSANAHRLDEYLQAVYVSVGTHRIVLQMNLTPGVAVVPQLMRWIDSDGDGRVSPHEGTAYAQRVLEEVRLTLDGNRRHLKLLDVTFPARADLDAGVGVILLTASVNAVSLTTGPHELAFANDHQPKISVYLVNALVPADKTIHIGRQIRDEVQRHYRLEFEVRAGPNEPRD